MKKALSGDDRYGGLTEHLNQKDAWAEGIIDGVEGFLKSAGLEKVIWLIVGFAAGYFGHVISVIIKRSS